MIKRKLEYAGHVLRGSSGLSHLQILEGKVEGKKKVGCPIRIWMNDICDWSLLGTYGSDVNKDSGHKAKAKAKDSSVKAKAKDSSRKAKAKAKDLTKVSKAKAKDLPIVSKAKAKDLQ